MASERPISASELATHSKEGDLWIAFHGNVYDCSKFVNVHPGGPKVMMDVAGSDGTEDFEVIHPKSFLAKLPPTANMGTITEDEAQKARNMAASKKSSGVASGGTPSCSGCLAGILNWFGSRPSDKKPPAPAEAPPAFSSLEQVLNMHDFELAAKSRMKVEGYTYYVSAACDELTHAANRSCFNQVWLCPTVMVDVSKVDLSCTLLGTKSAFPLFISPAAMAGLAHRDGEVALARGAGKAGIVQCVANMATKDFEDIVGARVPGQTQWFQLYVNPDRAISAKVIEKVMAAGIEVLFITVDTNITGRRERDQRHKIQDRSNVAKVQQQAKTSEGGMVGALGAFTCPALCWKDLEWVRSVTKGKMKLVLKGIQTGRDAVLAAKHGVDGIVVSNHGGRQLDTARPTLHMLAEVTRDLARANLTGSLEVLVDGGIQRGTDIYKALALGAKGCGIGRAALYSLTFGQDGVDRCLEIFRQEFLSAMQLMGKTSVSEISHEDVVCDFPRPFNPLQF